MTFEVIIAPSAFDELKERFQVQGGLPLELVSQIAQALEQLAADPVARSRRPLIPYPERGQLFPFECHVAGTAFRLVAIFSYRPDEKTIDVHKVRYERFVM